MRVIADDPQNRLHKGSELQCNLWSKWVQPFPRARMRLAPHSNDTASGAIAMPLLSHSTFASTGRSDDFETVNGVSTIALFPGIWMSVEIGCGGGFCSLLPRLSHTVEWREPLFFCII
jgi:hypothetical protein